MDRVINDPVKLEEILEELAKPNTNNNQLRIDWYDNVKTTTIKNIPVLHPEDVCSVLESTRIRDALLTRMSTTEVRKAFISWWNNNHASLKDMNPRAKAAGLTFMTMVLMLEDQLDSAIATRDAAAEYAVQIKEDFNNTNFLLMVGNACELAKQIKSSSGSSVSSEMLDSLLKNAAAHMGTEDEILNGVPGMPRVDSPSQLLQILPDLCPRNDWERPSPMVAVIDVDKVVGFVTMEQPSDESQFAKELALHLAKATESVGLVVISAIHRPGDFEAHEDVEAIEKWLTGLVGNKYTLLDVIRIYTGTSNYRSMLCDDESCCPMEGKPIPTME